MRSSPVQRGRISVLYFSNELVRGGAEEHILTLLRGLDRTSFHPHLACTPELAEKLGTDLPDDVEVLRLRLSKPADIGAALTLARAIRRLRIDVLHSHLFYASLFASPIGRIGGVPLIVETPHVREHWRRGLKASFAVDRLAGRAVDLYVAVSEANARYLVEQKGLPPQKILVIYNGCDLKRFDPNRVAPEGLRAQLGFAPDDPVLALIGRLEPQKGHRVLLDAFPEVRRQFPRAKLVCVGEGGLQGALEQRTAELGLGGAVRFVGQQANVEDWFALADVTVLPSFWEGLPLVAIESLAAGRPVVATAVDGTPEVVVDGKTGLTVPPGDSERLAQAIGRLLGDGALRQQLATAGRQWVTERFDAERQVRRTETLYQVALYHRDSRAGARPGPAGRGPR
jgi:glycosyltransferase involved in cell wall biosynthesis